MSSVDGFSASDAGLDRESDLSSHPFARALDGEASDWFSLTKGVLQRSALSPYLLQTFVDGLELKRDAATISRSLSYADDDT